MTLLAFLNVSTVFIVNLLYTNTAATNKHQTTQKFPPSSTSKTPIDDKPKAVKR